MHVIQGMERQAPERTSRWNVNNFNNMKVHQFVFISLSHEMKATVEVADPKTHRSEIETFEGILNIGREPITLTGVIFLRIHFPLFLQE